ncbi:MAG: hypothetical protein JNL32_14730, partial [Candidatus Kapabacteria bacterium]|nr:hypothetical protein [Candidatus Kapabacteria bacterium]
MNLDDYISGYVDGDLTPEEDAELRALIAGNPLAKEEFENAALISASILHDAENINVPDDVFEETGLLLSAAFRESVPQNATAAHSVHGRYRIAKKYVAVLALILVYVVSDVQRLNYNDVYSVFYKSNFSSIQLPDIQIESPRTTLPRVIGQQHRNSNSNVFTVADSQVHIDNAVTDGLKNEIASATQSQIPTVNITADTNTGLPPTAVIPLSLPMSLQSA